MKQFPQAVHPSLHFDKIFDNAIKPLGLEVVGFERGQNSIKFSVTMTTPESDQKINRTVTIHQLNYEGRFTVECKNTFVNYDFDLKKEKFEIDSNYDPDSPHYQEQPTSMDYCYRRIANFMRGEIDFSKLPSPEYFEKRDKINKSWLDDKGYKVELYCEDHHERDYRFQLVSDDGVVITRHLCIDTADGHTYRLFGDAIKAGFKRGIREGQMRSADNLARNIFQQVTTGMDNYDLKRYPEVYDLINSGSIRKSKDTI